MKKLIEYFQVIMVLFLYSCSKDLNVMPQSIVATNSMWQTKDDAEGAMYGMFAQLRNALSNNYIYWGDYRSGFFGSGVVPEGSQLDLYNNTIDREDPGTNWSGLYKTINDCNLILKYTPRIHFDNKKDKEFILANAYFVRALCYYYCARIWGDAPIVLSGFESDKQDDIYPTRSPKDSVLIQVASDIDQAISLFPNNSFISRKIGSKAAANMLKTDYYLWMAKVEHRGNEALNKALDAVEEVLGNPTFQLSDSYENVFRNDENSEIIFSLNFAKNEHVGGFFDIYLIAIQYLSSQNLINNPIPVGSHHQGVCFTPQFQAFLYNKSNDSRAKINIDTFTDPGNNIHFRWINKYLGEWENGTRYFTSDIKIYRFAEAILFKAEIENALGNKAVAVSELNKIANRAYGISDYYSPSLSGTEIDKAILDERLKEFAGEGKSWFDLIRFGAAFERITSLKGRDGEQNILLWPVNSESINSNPNITQTPGYN